MRASPQKDMSGFELLNEAIAEIEKSIPRTDREYAEILPGAAVKIADYLRQANAETGGTRAQADASGRKAAAGPPSAAELQAELINWLAVWSRSAPEPDALNKLALLVSLCPTITDPTNYNMRSVIANPAMAGALRLERRVRGRWPSMR